MQRLRPSFCSTVGSEDSPGDIRDCDGVDALSVAACDFDSDGFSDFAAKLGVRKVKGRVGELGLLNGASSLIPSVRTLHVLHVEDRDVWRRKAMLNPRLSSCDSESVCKALVKREGLRVLGGGVVFEKLWRG